jgi:outer membrane receptor protein involved in Fe transport
VGFWKNTINGLLFASMLGTTSINGPLSSNLFAKDKNIQSLEQVILDDGGIKGKIRDAKTGEELIGANILVQNTNTGASTDIDGVYQIKNLNPGEYSIKISYISYKPVIVEHVKVLDGIDTNIDILMEPATTELDEVIVTADALKNTEANLLKIQKNSASIMDGFSSELIKKNNSSDGADVLKRMTGINLSEGKYAFIRGVGDRYNNTSLNGSSLPSTDPEKKSFSYDIFPASLIETIITSKTFTPDKPADFAGGLVQISTIEFPSSFILDFSSSATYDQNTSGKTFFTYNGGKKDFLGYDDGTRDMPSSITDTRISRGNYSDSALTEITKTFGNNWQTINKNAPINGSLKFSLGDKIDIGEDILGYMTSVLYSNSRKTKDLKKNFYDFSGARYSYDGVSYTNSAMLGMMLNLSFKFNQTNKISSKNMFNQNADDIVTLYRGDYRYADQYREITLMNYVSRSLLSNQLTGQHLISLLNGLGLEWNINYSQSERNEPDARRYAYSRDIMNPEEPLRFILDQSISTRYYGKLNDINRGAYLDLDLKIFENPQLPKVKFGLFLNRKVRDFDARTFGFKNIPGGNFALEDSVLRLPIEQIFDPENITKKFIQVTEITKPSDSYLSEQSVNAGYAMIDAGFLDKFRLIAGARYELSNQKMTAIDLLGDSINVNNIYRDVLPSVNLIYSVNDWINLRGAYSKTLSRPEFREMAPFSYFDFIDNELIQGNPDLKRTLINNYDFRVEMYPGAGELVALGLFYKNFKDPIEETLQASANEPIRTFENANSAKNYGLELELRKSLGFIDFMKHFSFVGNAALIKSNIELKNDGFQQGERLLQGQAPYMFNLGLYYDNTDLGLNSGLVYNKVGERISKVGSKDLGNIIEKPVDLIDFYVSKNLFDNFTIKFGAKDLLNQDRIMMQQSPIGDKIFGLEHVGRNFSLDISYKLN